MIIETDKLITVRHLADLRGVTTTAVYGWVAQNKEKSVKIDGVTFIILDKNEEEEKKKNAK